MQILNQAKQKMFRSRLGTILSMVFFCLLFFSCQSPKQEGELGQANVKGLGKLIYSCPMHPAINQNTPGICSVCKMDLVLMDANLRVQGKPVDVSLEELIQSGSGISISSVMVVSPERKVVNTDFKAPGSITYDTRMFSNVSARMSGRIEKMYVQYAFQEIKKGDKLFDIYSPEIITPQRDLIYLMNHNYTLEELKKTASLIEDAREKLFQLGFTRDEVDQIERSKKGLDVLTVYSPSEGHLHELQMNDYQSGEGMYSPNQIQNPRLSLKEGMYVKKGQNVLSLIYPHTVWAELNIFPEDYPKIHLKQEVSIALNDRKDTLIKGKIDFIEPIYTKNIKSLRVRVTLDNFKHILKVGQLVSATIQSSPKEGLWIPISSVINLGTRKMVWIQKSKGVLVPKEIMTGGTTASMYEVTSGLDEKDRIALNAAFILDSETFIQ